MESFESADNLAVFIRIGSIPLTLNEVSSNVVAAQLGHNAIRTSVIAAAIGLIVLCIFMIVSYRIPGVVATLALWIYTALVLVLVSVYDITLTLHVGYPFFFPGSIDDVRYCRYGVGAGYGCGCQRSYLFKNT